MELKKRLVKLLIYYSIFPVLAILFALFNEDLNSILKFSSNGPGLCDEGSFCWIWGYFAIYGLATLSFLVGIVHILIAGRARQS